jgi:hypothetical protein
MLPDDIFRSKLQTTITALRYWAPAIADSARVEENETGSFWKTAVAPFTPNACPFELIMHFDQHYDVALDDETYEGLPIEGFDMFLPFVEAIAAGNVVQRHWVSRFTGLERSVETVVTLRNGGIWRETRGTVRTNAPPAADDGSELIERRFLPYRR